MLTRLCLLIIILLLTSCSTTTVLESTKEEPDFDYSTLYLRGSFSWWEAEETYRVSEIGNDQYKAVVALRADGQPYDFKFADKNWTMGLNCGFLDKEDDEVITLGKSVAVNCSTPVDNFIFVPQENGKYIFTIDFSGWGSPKLTVDKL